MTAIAHQSEAELQGAVIDLAERLRWLVYHTHDSRHSAKGFPDLCLARGERLVFAELKTENGKLSDAQREWLQALEIAGAECFVWRPSQFDEILGELRRT